MSTTSDLNKVIDASETAAAALNGMRRQLINAGWSEHGAEMAVIAIIQSQGSDQ